MAELAHKEKTATLKWDGADLKIIQKPKSENNNGNLVVIHGSNLSAYHREFTKKQQQMIELKFYGVRDKVTQYSLDDAGNTEFFIDIYGLCVRYNCDEKAFYIWTGRKWLIDTENTLQHWCLKAMKFRRDRTIKYLGKHPACENKSELQKHVKSCCNRGSIRTIIDGLKSELAVKSDIFDKKRHLLNVLNGTIDLQTGKLLPHNRSDMITKLIPIAYREDEQSTTFNNFLYQTFQDDKLISYVQRLFGYCVTGETGEQVIHFFIGNGANGKSTLILAIRYVVSDYAEVIPAKVITSIERSGSASSEIAQLPHKRLVCCSELNCTDMLNEGKIKIMSSGETISARQLYNPSFTFDPEFKFIVDTNYLPVINGTDHGIWRRIRVVPFEHTVPKNEINKNLLTELKNSRGAILSWLVQGAVNYYKHGLEPCFAVEKATKRYRKTQDTLGSFVEACVKEKSGQAVRARELYEAYLSFCTDNFLTPMSETKFGKDFSALGYKRGKDKISRKYLDICLKCRD